jgi:hypothetical protein
MGFPTSTMRIIVLMLWGVLLLVPYAFSRKRHRPPVSTMTMTMAHRHNPSLDLPLLSFSSIPDSLHLRYQLLVSPLTLWPQLLQEQPLWYANSRKREHFLSFLAVTWPTPNYYPLKQNFVGRPRQRLFHFELFNRVCKYTPSVLQCLLVHKAFSRYDWLSITLRQILRFDSTGKLI